MTAEEILLIILSTALAVFLVLGIILLSFLIAIAGKIKRIIAMAERTIDHIEDLASNVQRFVTPATVGSAIMDTINRFVEKRRNK